MKHTHFFLLLLFFVNCGQPPAEQKDYSYLDAEIAQLQTDMDIRIYWETIYDDDQKYRREESLILQQYGYESKEYKDAWKKINEMDDLNIVKVEKMLAKIGYPQTKELSSKAASAPYIVIHHSSDYDTRKRNFHHLYDAYKTGNLKEGPFSLYLNRTYEIKNGKRYEVGAVFKEEERIKEIIEELGLEE
jgi:hypothetical protein